MDERRKIQILKIISLFGIIGVAFYFLHVIVGGILYEGYNPFAQAVSDLTASNSPSRKIASTLAFIYGIFEIVFKIGFFVYFKGKINKAISVGSCLFLIMGLISSFGYTLFPLSEAGYAGTFQDIMHVVVTVCVVVFTVISLIFFSIGFLKTKNCKYIGVISICTLALLLIGALLLNVVPKTYFGVAERINVYSVVIYTGVLSLWMYRYIKKIGTHN